MSEKSNVVPIRKWTEMRLEEPRTGNLRVNPPLVELLERMLASAKRGEITNMVGVSCDDDENFGTFHAGICHESVNRLMMIGALDFLVDDVKDDWMVSDNPELAEDD